MRTVHFLLESDFQVIGFFILLKIRYAVKFIYNWARQLFSAHYKIISGWFIENQSWKWCWRYTENRSGQILLSLLGYFL